MIKNRKTKQVKIGNVYIGANNPIAVQSMLNVHVSNVQGNVQQAQRLFNAGCNILRVTIPTPNNAILIKEIKANVNIPLVADIHFDYRAAIAAVKAGADKIRINPGNIGGDENVKAVANICEEYNVPIRIGVNAGSLEKEILAKHGSATADALVESALYHVNLLNKHNFNNIVISIKSSNVPTVISAYTKLSTVCNYPLHVGVTEAGTYAMGLIKSAMGIGGLLINGIGDTIRVSLTDEPEKEIKAGFDILRAAGYDVAGPEIISCPTCGRTEIDVAQIATEVEDRLKDCKKSIKVAVMGCVVNGPGEAKGADIGIAGGKNNAVLFVKGERVKTIKGDIVGELCKEIDKLVK